MASSMSQALLSTHCITSHSNLPQPLISIGEIGKQDSEMLNTLSHCWEVENPQLKQGYDSAYEQKLFTRYFLLCL